MENTTENKVVVVEKKNEARGIIILGCLVIALILFKVFIYPHFE